MNAPTVGIPPRSVTILEHEDFLLSLTAAIAGARLNIAAAVYMARAPRDSDEWPYRHLWDALRAAPARLNSCRITLNQSFGGSGMSGHNTAAAAVLTRAGWNVRHAPPSLIQHQKLWLIDNQLSYVGSQNLGYDPRTKTSNLSLRLDSGEVTLRLLNIFNRAWASHSRLDAAA